MLKNRLRETLTLNIGIIEYSEHCYIVIMGNVPGASGRISGPGNCRRSGVPYYITEIGNVKPPVRCPFDNLLNTLTLK